MLRPSALLLYEEFIKYPQVEILEVSDDFNSFFVAIKDKLLFIKGIHTPLNTQNAAKLSNLKISSKQALMLNHVPTLPSIYYVSKDHKSFEEVESEILEFISTHKRLVAKPIDGLKSRHIFLDITDLTSAQKAWEVIQKKEYYKGIIYEKFTEGDVHRLLYLNGELIAALRREKAFVLGDGTTTLRELINQKNNHLDNSHRYVGRINPEEKLKILYDQGYELDSIPEFNSKIFLEIDFSNVETVSEITDLVNKELAEKIGKFCKRIELNLAGVDIITKDISKVEGSWVVEVNKEPGIDFHHSPDYGRKLNVAEKIVKAIIDNYSK